MEHGYILPKLAKKGEAFTLNFINITSGSGGSLQLPTVTKISKDGGLFSATTNSVVASPDDAFLASVQSLDLTADEMNADVIRVYVQYSSDTNGVRKLFVIYTDGFTGFEASSGGATAQEVWEYGTRSLTEIFSIYGASTVSKICEAVNAGYSLTKLARNESGYNYYGLNSSDSWWFIIKEKTDFSETLYVAKHKVNQSFNDGWTNRASLSYTDEIDFQKEK